MQILVFNIKEERGARTSKIYQYYKTNKILSYVITWKFYSKKGFLSVNYNIVTNERNQPLETGIKSLGICKDYKNLQPESDIATTKNMINYMKIARAEYALYLEKMKDENVKETLKRKPEDLKEERILKGQKKKDHLKEKLKLVASENELLKKQETSYSLLSNSNLKLGNAVKNNDLQTVIVAQMMLNTENSSIKEVSQELASLKKGDF